MKQYIHKCYVCGDDVERTRKTGTYRCFKCKKQLKITKYSYRSASVADFENYKNNLK